ncbi:MAG: hypothetical protein P4M15_08130 [Alphaproteobacteria bacterium]|nr:hypothetical protein [Alphaproteobacteria bacterium]
MMKPARLSSLFAFMLACAAPVQAQTPASAPPSAPDDTLRVVKADINAEQDDAELCLNFDKPLAQVAPARLASSLRLTLGGNPATPQNIAVTSTSLCLFPLDRGRTYRLSLASMRGSRGEKMEAPYALSFTVPDRSPSLAFTNNGGAGGFNAYDAGLVLRAVNVAHAKIQIYRLASAGDLAHAWQERAQTSLAPSESAYFARTNGQLVAVSDRDFEDSANATSDQKINLRDKFPALAPGLYLIVAEASGESDSPASKGLKPLAAAWFTKSDFSVRAVRDDDGIHVFAASANAPGPKSGLHLTAINKKSQQVAEAVGGADGTGLIPYPPNVDKNIIASVIASDAAGDVAFAPIDAVPALSQLPPSGRIDPLALFTAPGDIVDAALTLAPGENAPDKTPGQLQLSRDGTVYQTLPNAAPNATLSFPAPARQGLWHLQWQKKDGGDLASAPLRVTSNPDTPHFDLSADAKSIGGDAQINLTVKAVALAGQPSPLAGGRVTALWQKIDPEAAGWKNYQFGVPVSLDETPAPVASVLTDLQGNAELHVALPKPPQEPGLYQAAIGVAPEPDSGIVQAAPLVLPLRSDNDTIGVKPLAAHARFAQNGIARFALIALAPDGKPRDLPHLSYQLYEEGRDFAWYQDEGRWKYKPEPQLRPIGGGDLSIRADGGTILEWPVTAGNYRLEILGDDGGRLAQTAFSAGWDSATPQTMPGGTLTVTLPKILTPGHSYAAHVVLPEAAMITAIIADQHIRKVVHEFRPKGDNAITFTPAADWRNGVSVSIDAQVPATQEAPMEGSAEALLADTAPPPAKNPAVELMAATPPDAAPLREGKSATLLFGIENSGGAIEAYRYAFTASAGLEIGEGSKGSVALKPGESRSLTVTLTGLQSGAHEIRLEAVGSHTPRAARSWPLSVLPWENFLHAGESVTLEAQQTLPPATLKAQGEDAVLFAARRPIDGLPEVLAFAFTAQPFTTEEIALNAEALRLWGGLIAQSGLADEGAIAARRQKFILRLLRRQNADGGFAAMRGGASTIADTAAALIALGPDGSAVAAPGKALAIGWLKQQLANTWFDENERAPRAAAYAGLADADALDAASLHYFSDTSAAKPLPAEAEADMAASFKHLGDPNAAAFWIKRMLTDHGDAADPQLLGDLSATDALSSDAVHTDLREMAQGLDKGVAPSIVAASSLLRAAYADNATAGKARLTVGTDMHDIPVVMALRNPPSLHNPDALPLSVTFAHKVAHPAPATASGLARRIYRLNGIEVTGSSKPGTDDVYVIEIKGTLAAAKKGQRWVMQESSDADLRPAGCPLSSDLGNLPFIPWLMTQGLTPVDSCEVLPHGLSAAFTAGSDGAAFRAVYLAHIDAASIGTLSPSRARLLP